MLSRVGLALALAATAASASASEHDVFLRAREAGCSGHALQKQKREEGTVDGPTTSAEAMHYNCDESKCKLPDCHCASTVPPGGLSKDQVPQFILFTADDAVQRYTIDAVNSVLANRKNPNGCPVTMTYFTSTQWTDYGLVTDWYVAGNEIADHTMNHVGNPNSDEIIGNLQALNAFSGIPQKSMSGFRAPFLDYSIDMLQRIKSAQFTYDSSSSSTIAASDPTTDAFWPYTLDYGLANDCLAQKCGDSGLKLPGLWEIPMYAIFDERGAAGPHLMDPWLDAKENFGNTSKVVPWMQNAFNDHYKNANRQPFGIYTHPTHFAPGVPNTPLDKDIPNSINDFLDWAQQQPDVWLVTNAQLIAWMRNPVPASELNNMEEFRCGTPDVQGKVCNGVPANEEGLLDTCSFEDYPWHTCYGCPARQPSVNDPTPEQKVPDGQQPRFSVPMDCDTAFFDPIAGKCLCSNDACKFADTTRPIGPNGSNLTSGGTRLGDDGTSTPVDPYKPFGDAALHQTAPVFGALAAAAIGMLLSL